MMPDVILNFQKVLYCAISGHGRMANVYVLNKFDELATEIWPKQQTEDGGCRHLEFPKSTVLGDPRMANSLGAEGGPVRNHMSPNFDS